MEEGCACALECSMKNKNSLYFRKRGATSSLPATPSCALFLSAVHVCAWKVRAHIAPWRSRRAGVMEEQTKQ